jgi:flagellar biosynthesis/type III secretory pathway protein FliH
MMEITDQLDRCQVLNTDLQVGAWAEGNQRGTEEEKQEEEKEGRMEEGKGIGTEKGKEEAAPGICDRHSPSGI